MDAIKEIKKENIAIEGYLNQKEIIHIIFVLLTWSLSSGYITFFLNLLPFWAQPITTIVTTTLVGIWKVLKYLDRGI